MSSQAGFPAFSRAGHRLPLGSILLFAGVQIVLLSSTVAAGGDGASTSPLQPRGSVPLADRDLAKLDDPRQDGWDTEAFNNRAGDQLKVIEKWLEGAKSPTPEVVESVIAGSFSGSRLLPSQLKTVYHSGNLRVERASAIPLEGQVEGIAGFLAALSTLREPFDQTTEREAKFKQFRVDQTEAGMRSQVYFSLSQRTADEMVEQHATWVLDWTIDTPEAPPRIRGIAVTAFEQVTRASAKWFVDCTDSILRGTDCYQSQLLQGYGHWLERTPHGIYLETFGSPGLAVGDVNGDGLDDLYLCQERALPNRLFLQEPNGTTQEVSADWGVDWLESSRAALLLDLDNDGDQDLAVSVVGGVVLASNEGDRFRFRTLLPTTEDLMSLASADYDGDGDLDLYACGYYADKLLDAYGEDGSSAMPTGGAGFVMHDANTGGPNHLLRNELGTSPSDWTFTDVTKEVGLDTNNRRFSFGAAWEDYDNDGDQDLYVANDFGRDNLYRNDGGRFVDVSDSAKIEDAGTGMGVTWGDFDRDGLMDAYVSNMFSAAGNRITFQEKFKAGAAPEIRERIQRLARGNTLLQNAGDGSFQNLSSTGGAEMGRWAWASHFADLNNDGWEDLVVANGYITTEDTGDL